ncbi:hypothetical protein [Streptomyces chartreusis]|uniref:hypothetical protein n=1 Tax=Streptomyces chartreusis TaxID=1969 RepID=UPI00366322ED
MGALLSRTESTKQPAAGTSEAEFVVAALAAGVSARLKGSPSSVLGDAYASLREAIRRHLAADGKSGERILEASENDSGEWQSHLRDLLSASPIGSAADLLAAAQFLRRQLDQSSGPARTHMEFRQTRGVMAGDHQSSIHGAERGTP